MPDYTLILQIFPVAYGIVGVKCIGWLCHDSSLKKVG